MLAPLDKKLDHKRVQEHRLARRIAADVLKAIQTHTLSMNIPAEWSTKYPKLHGKLGGDKKRNLLSMIVKELLNLCRHEKKKKHPGNPVLAYEKTFFSDRISSSLDRELELDKLFEYGGRQVGLESLVTAFLSEGSHPLHQAMEGAISAAQQKEENKKKLSKMKAARALENQVRGKLMEKAGEKAGIGSQNGPDSTNSAKSFLDDAASEGEDNDFEEPGLGGGSGSDSDSDAEMNDVALDDLDKRKEKGGEKETMDVSSSSNKVVAVSSWDGVPPCPGTTFAEVFGFSENGGVSGISQVVVPPEWEKAMGDLANRHKEQLEEANKKSKEQKGMLERKYQTDIQKLHHQNQLLAQELDQVKRASVAATSQKILELEKSMREKEKQFKTMIQNAIQGVCASCKPKFGIAVEAEKATAPLTTPSPGKSSSRSRPAVTATPRGKRLKTTPQSQPKNPPKYHTTPTRQLKTAPTSQVSTPDMENEEHEGSKFPICPVCQSECRDSGYKCEVCKKVIHCPCGKFNSSDKEFKGAPIKCNICLGNGKMGLKHFQYEE